MNVLQPPSVRPRRGGAPFLSALLLAAALLASLPGCRGCSGAPEGKALPAGSPGTTGGSAASTLEPDRAVLVEEFAVPGPPDPARWALTRQHDFEEAVVEQVADPLQPGDGRLRLAAATIGTLDSTVKYQGLVLRQPIDLTQPLDLEVELDWAHQANGCYLTQEITLSPTWTTENPLDAKEWLSFRFVGLPPGDKARPEVMRTNNGNLQVVERFGWPEVKPGRDLGRTTVRLQLEGRALRASIDGKQVLAVEDCGIRFDRAYLYLQMSSHSNYTRRVLFFDRVALQGKLLPAAEPQPAAPSAAQPQPAAPPAAAAGH